MRTFLNNVLRRKSNWIGHSLRCLHDAIEEEMTEVNAVRRRRRQLFDDLINRRRYWELKEEAEDRNRWKIRKKYISSLSHGTANKQHT